MVDQCKKCQTALGPGRVKCPKCGELYFENAMAGAAAAPPPVSPQSVAATVPKTEILTPAAATSNATDSSSEAVQSPPSVSNDAMKQVSVHLTQILGKAEQVREILKVLNLQRTDLTQEITENVLRVLARRLLWMRLLTAGVMLLIFLFGYLAGKHLNVSGQFSVKAAAPVAAHSESPPAS